MSAFSSSLPWRIIPLTGECSASLLKAACVMAGDRVLSVNHLGLTLRPALFFFSPPTYSGFWTFFGRFLAVPGPVFPFSVVSCCSPTSILFSGCSSCLHFLLVKPALCSSYFLVLLSSSFGLKGSPKFLITGSAYQKGPQGAGSPRTQCQQGGLCWTFWGVETPCLLSQV